MGYMLTLDNREYSISLPPDSEGLAELENSKRYFVLNGQYALHANAFSFLKHIGIVELDGSIHQFEAVTLRDANANSVLEAIDDAHPEQEIEHQLTCFPHLLNLQKKIASLFRAQRVRVRGVSIQRVPRPVVIDYTQRLFQQLIELENKYRRHPVFKLPDQQALGQLREDGLSVLEVLKAYGKSIESSLEINESLLVDRQEMRSALAACGKHYVLWSGSLGKAFVEQHPALFSDLDIENSDFSDGYDRQKVATYSLEKIRQIVEKVSLHALLLLGPDTQYFCGYSQEIGVAASTQNFFWNVEKPVVSKMHQFALVNSLNLFGKLSSHEARSGQYALTFHYAYQYWGLMHTYDFTKPTGGIPDFELLDYHPNHVTQSEKDKSHLGRIWRSLKEDLHRGEDSILLGGRFFEMQ